MPLFQAITPCLWFDDQAEAAARLYTGIFPNSRVTKMLFYNGAGEEIHGQPAGKVMTVSFELDGQPFTALNGGPLFQFNEAVSFQILCETQEELDRYWDRLAEGGDPEAQQCGWLKDRFGVSWQVTPRILIDMLADPDPVRSRRTMEEVLKMKKFDIAALERVHAR